MTIGPRDAQVVRIRRINADRKATDADVSTLLIEDDLTVRRRQGSDVRAAIF
jgi:hypothetical protein